MSNALEAVKAAVSVLHNSESPGSGGVNAASVALDVSIFTQAECGVYFCSPGIQVPHHVFCRQSTQCMHNSDMRLKIASQAARCTSAVNSSVDAKRNVHFALSNIISRPYKLASLSSLR